LKKFSFAKNINICIMVLITLCILIYIKWFKLFDGI
jgi:hypothetical protein